MCIMSAYALQKVIECSVHVSDGFPKKNWNCELYPIFLGIFQNFF